MRCAASTSDSDASTICCCGGGGGGGGGAAEWNAGSSAATGSAGCWRVTAQLTKLVPPSDAMPCSRFAVPLQRAMWVDRMVAAQSRGLQAVRYAGGGRRGRRRWSAVIGWISKN